MTALWLQRIGGLFFIPGFILELDLLFEFHQLSFLSKGTRLGLALMLIGFSLYMIGERKAENKKQQ